MSYGGKTYGLDDGELGRRHAEDRFSAMGLGHKVRKIVCGYNARKQKEMVFVEFANTKMLAITREQFDEMEDGMLALLAADHNPHESGGHCIIGSELV